MDKNLIKKVNVALDEARDYARINGQWKWYDLFNNTISYIQDMCEESNIDYDKVW